MSGGQWLKVTLLFILFFFIVNEMNLKIEGNKNEQSPALINTNGNDKREKKWMSWVNELPWMDELKNDIWLYYWLLSQIVEPIICYGDYNLL